MFGVRVAGHRCQVSGVRCRISDSGWLIGSTRAAAERASVIDRRSRLKGLSIQSNEPSGMYWRPPSSAVTAPQGHGGGPPPPGIRLNPEALKAVVLQAARVLRSVVPRSRGPCPWVLALDDPRGERHVSRWSVESISHPDFGFGFRASSFGFEGSGFRVQDSARPG